MTISTDIQQIIPKPFGLTFYEKTIEKTDEAYNIAKELVEKLFFGMSKLSTKYCNDIFCDLPFLYSERRLDCVLLPTLSKICNSMVLVELPVNREYSKNQDPNDQSSGRIDYWCIYKEYSFIIELKHSYDCFTTPITRERKILERWLEMNTQLKSVKYYAKQCEEKTKGVIRLGLHLITSYCDKYPNKELVSCFKESVHITFRRLAKDIPSPKPDMMLCWSIPHNIVFSYERTYPGLWALAKIYPPIHHHGAIK